MTYSADDMINPTNEPRGLGLYNARAPAVNFFHGFCSYSFFTAIKRNLIKNEVNFKMTSKFDVFAN